MKAPILMYLEAGYVNGIGPELAKRIYKKFGDESYEKLSDPHLLSEVDGIGKTKAESITKNWLESKKTYEDTVFFQEHGITPAVSMKIMQYYGKNFKSIVLANPYLLARDIRGVGFTSADKIAMKVGIDKDSTERVRAVIEHLLNEWVLDGSCGAPIREFVMKCAEYIESTSAVIISVLKNMLDLRLIFLIDYSYGINPNNEEENLLNQKYTKECNEIPDIYNEEQCRNKILMLPVFYRMERQIAKKLIEISHDEIKPFKSINCNESIIMLCKKFNIELSEGQKESIHMVMNNKVSVITGGPGTGKTKLIFSLIQIFKSLGQSMPTIKIAAPTGKAAKRVSESTGSFATTIHRLLEFDAFAGGFRYNENRLLKCDVLIIDESSMLDIRLVHSLLKAISTKCSIIFVGDIDQIPSVGPGQFLKDIILSEKFPVQYLNHIFRQASSSQIVRYAHFIKDGKIPTFEYEGFDNTFANNYGNVVFINANEDEDIPTKIIQILESNFFQHVYKIDFKSKEDMKELQILTPMQKGKAGVIAINQAIQSKFNNEIQYIKGSQYNYKVGDKIIQIENNYNKNIFNGDIGFIQSINASKREFIIRFDDEKDIIYKFNEIEQISLAYAITIHKSQGSEYKTVIVPIIGQHFVMLNRNLFYTALTRAKKLVVFIGQKRALGLAVRNTNNFNRNTLLRWILKDMN